MSPLTFVRTSIRRPVLALLIVGGVMTMSPVHAALPISDLFGEDAPVNLDGALSGPTNLVGGVLGDDLLGGDLAAGDLVGGVLGGDLLGGDLLGGDLPAGDLVGGVLGGDLLGGDLLGGVLGGDDDPAASSAQAAGSEEPEGGISIAGLHIGMKGHINSLEELLDPCDSLTGRIHTGIQGADLTLAKALPAPTSCADPAPPVSNPGPPTSPPRTNPIDVLPAALEQPTSVGRVVSPPMLSVPAPVPAAALAQPVLESAPAGLPTNRTALPRTGPGFPFQGPFALALLGFSGALRAAIGRRRPELS